MQTPSHFLMTAALRKALPRVRMVPSAVLIGSVAPDIPLYLLSLGADFYFQHLLGWSASATARHMYDTLFFYDPYWIACHNLLHSLVCLVTGLVMVRMFNHRWPRLCRWLFWFLAACLLHTLVDMATHFDDGPVALWPLDWSTRFSSPVSYWDPAHHGRQFVVFELVLDVVLSTYLFVPWFWRLVAKRFQPQEV